ncbi:MAG: hypothetical protein LBU66_04975, partial [Treponema sp.]|nr:hypothetical protein [Treponema sp.]
MKNKVKIALIAILGCAILALTMTACDDGDTSHICSFVDWTETTAATCNAAAIETGTCSCGKTSTRTKPDGVPNPALHVFPAWGIPTCIQAANS